MGGVPAPVPEGYVVRPARVDDLAALADVERAAGDLFRTVGMDDVADHEADSIEALDEARADGRLWVAHDGAGPVGYALALDLEGQPHLEQLSVDPAHGRRGLGSALVAAVDAWAGGIEGAHRLTLSTFRDVAWNAPYYRSLGFREVPAAELTPALLAVRHHEAALGLDVDARIVMARPLERTGGFV
jgi:GNAT superfamily N-acetyltransferase